MVLPRPARGAGTLIPSAQRLVWVDGEGNGTPLQYSCLENPMDKELDRAEQLHFPVVRTRCFHCRGPGFHPWLGN